MKQWILILICWVSSSLGIMAQQLPYSSQKEALGRNGMVVSAHPLASQVGLEVLKKGGNAIDAAVAVQFALAVVYPQAGNIGGGGFLIYRSAATGELAALDYREKAPAAATENMYVDSLGRVTDRSRFGVLASGVPGTVDGMWEAHKKYGKLPWGQLVMPAVELAEQGFVITVREAENLNKEKINFLKNNSILPVFFRMTAWEAGDTLIQKDLANSLSHIAGDGRKAFYEGPVASLIVYEMNKQKGLITAEDLKNYHSVWRTPLTFDYKGMQVVTMPPPSSGGIILRQLLGMTEGKSLATSGFHSTEAIHLMAEAERRAYADRATHMGDPDFWKVPVNTLTSPEYIQSRMADFRPDTVTLSASVMPGQIKESEETTHSSIVDKDGNAVSVTTTLNDSYGSRTVVSNAGFILNNEMDDFSAKPGVPNLYGAIGGKANAIRGNKRPLSSMTPTMVVKDRKMLMIVGTPGGTTIPTTVFQIITNVFEFNMTLSEAVQAKRFHHQWLPDVITYEEGAIFPEIESGLAKKGHKFQLRSTPMGRVEAIMRLPDATWMGVADNRGDDSAAGY
jgi:gamma-glutamyltranspeptidase / glutathione hydrolase